MKTLDGLICFTFGYPSLFIAHTYKIIPINVCMFNTEHRDSVYTLPLNEQVHSCLLLLRLDANNVNELQVKFVSPATTVNAIFNTLIIPSIMEPVSTKGTQLTLT